MSKTGVYDAKLEQLGRNSARAALLTLAGFVLILGSLIYGTLKVTALREQKQALERDVATLQKTTSDLHLREALLNRDLSTLKETISNLQLREVDLRQTQIGILNFLGGVTSGEQIRLIDKSVNWSKTRESIIVMPNGPRKVAILDALLLAWKNLPFSLENHGLSGGLDSPHFINVVLKNTGIRVRQADGEKLSDAMMRQFQRVEDPLPADLIFYRGNVGSFVLMYIGPGSERGKGVAVGTLQGGEEVQVIDTMNVNTPAYPFIGYFRVPYPKPSSAGDHGATQR